MRAFRPFPWLVLSPYLSSHVGTDKSKDLDHFAKWFSVRSEIT